VEDGGSIGTEFGDGADVTPVGKDMPCFRDDLRTAGRGRKDIVWRKVASELSGRIAGVVELDDATAGVGPGGHRVVKDGNRFQGSIGRSVQEPRVVLEAKAKVIGQRKCRLVINTTQLPDQRSVGTIELVYCTGMPRRDNEVLFVIFVDAVDVEPIPSITGIQGREGATDWNDAVWRLSDVRNHGWAWNDIP
jgi:hypothetical protein